MIVVLLTMLSSTSSDNYAILMSLYEATNGTGWDDKTGWLNGDPCSPEWHGVTCTDGEVTELRLGSYNSLDGTLPTQLGKLTELTYFDLGANSLDGTLLTQFGKLTALTELMLNTNSLDGTLPTIRQAHEADSPRPRHELPGRHASNSIRQAHGADQSLPLLERP